MCECIFARVHVVNVQRRRRGWSIPSIARSVMMLWGKCLAAKTRLREYCLSSVRHATANVAIKVKGHTLTKMHRIRARDRQHTLFSWGGTWQESSVGVLTEGGERKRRRWETGREENVMYLWSRISHLQPERALQPPAGCHDFVKCHCSPESLRFVLFSSDFGTLS